MSGVPVAAVRDMAGHEDKRTTQEYTHLVMGYLQTEASKIAPVMSATETSHNTYNNESFAVVAYTSGAGGRTFKSCHPDHTHAGTYGKTR